MQDIQETFQNTNTRCRVTTMNSFLYQVYIFLVDIRHLLGPPQLQLQQVMKYSSLMPS